MAVHQTPPSMGFSRQEHWSGLPFPSPIYSLLYIKQITNKDLLYSTVGNSTQYSVMTYMETESKKEWRYMYTHTYARTHAHTQLTHFAAQQKLT